jgi:hypothetical protein
VTEKAFDRPWLILVPLVALLVGMASIDTHTQGAADVRTLLQTVSKTSAPIA